MVICKKCKEVIGFLSYASALTRLCSDCLKEEKDGDG